MGSINLRSSAERQRTQSKILCESFTKFRNRSGTRTKTREVALRTNKVSDKPPDILIVDNDQLRKKKIGMKTSNQNKFFPVCE